MYALADKRNEAPTEAPIAYADEVHQYSKSEFRNALSAFRSHYRKHQRAVEPLRRLNQHQLNSTPKRNKRENVKC